MKKKIKLIIILLISIGLVTTVTATYSKYISNSFWNYYLKSQHFYLESNGLSVNGTNNSNTLWTGERVEFKLNNYLNDNLITESDISYKAECEIVSDNKDDLICKINNETIYTGTLSSYQECINETDDGKDVNGYTKSDCEIKGYTYLINKASKDLYFEITPKEPEYKIDEVKVKVTVISTSPYKKTLVGYYDLNKSEINTGNIEKEYKNIGEYSVLLITNSYNEEKCMNVKWDETTKLISSINNDYEIVDKSKEYINEINLKIEKQSNKEYIFYDKDRTIDDFEIEIVECDQ